MESLNNLKKKPVPVQVTLLEPPALDPELAPLPYSKVGGNLEMKSDKMFGWRPQAGKLEIAPIPLCFGLVEYNVDDLIKPDKIVYMGPRYQNSFKMHERFANQITPMTVMRRSRDTGQLNKTI